MIKRFLAWWRDDTEVGCDGVIVNKRPYINASDVRACRPHELPDDLAAAVETARMEARIAELETENARLNMEMAAYRQGCTPKDAAAMLAVVDALEAEKRARPRDMVVGMCDRCGNEKSACACPTFDGNATDWLSGHRRCHCRDLSNHDPECAQSDRETKPVPPKGVDARQCEMCGNTPCVGCNKCCGYIGVPRRDETGACNGCG